MKVDRFFSDDLSKHLFETQDSLGRAFHFDLIAINIQRGRDHGIQSYTKAREFCGLSPIRTWEDLRQVMPADIWTVYRSFFRFVDDIDLFTASVAEIKEPNAMIGPTLKCLLGAQFRDLKFGDRFWYETTEQPIGFTPGYFIAQNLPFLYIFSIINGHFLS
jgi:peroxidase